VFYRKKEAENIIGSKEGSPGIVEDLINLSEETGLERDGLIPSWSEIANRFNLDQLNPGDYKIVQEYYRIQRIFARGKLTKGKRARHGLFENPVFLALEDREPELLMDIANLVRGPSERTRGQY